MPARAAVAVLLAAVAAAVLAPAPAAAVTTVDVLEPAALRQLYVTANGVPNTAATFGEPSYSASLSGVILHATPGHLDGCELNQTFVDEEKKRLAPDGGDVIILVDRGDCSFSQKVRNVQNAGGVAAIVANNMTMFQHRIIMRPDGKVEQPDIPSVFISKEDGDRISRYVLNETRADPVVLRMTWGLPHPDGRVEWRLWTTSVDRESVAFKREYEEVAAALGNRSEFDVGYQTFRNYGRHDEKDCYSGGRYCASAEDPAAKYTGRTIVRENLRQACVHRHGNSTGKTQLWWRYVNTFEDDCYANLTEENHVQCSNAALRKVGVDPAVVDDCIASTTNSESHSNSILEKFYVDQFDQIVRFTPVVMVNEEKHRGALTCPSPARLGSCLILKAICAGYAEDLEPEACVQYGDCPLLQRPGDGKCDSNATDTNQHSTSSGHDGVSAGTVVGIVLAVVVVVVAGVVLYVRRQRQQMRIDLDSILSSYMPVDSEGRPVPQDKTTRAPEDDESAALM